MLAEKLVKYKNANAVVYALPRGGVVVAYEIARALSAPLDLVITRKIGHPQNPEYAVCAVSESGELECDERAVSMVGMEWIRQEAARQVAEARRRRKKYLGRESLSPEGKTAVIVDDGIATGLSIGLAVKEIRKQRPAKIIVAVPVASADAVKRLEKEGVEVLCLEDPQHFLGAVGAHYASFPQVEDDEVVELLDKSYEKTRD